MDSYSVKDFKRKYSTELILLVLAFVVNRLFAGIDFVIGSNWSLFFGAVLVYISIVKKRIVSPFKSSDSSGRLLLVALLIAEFNALIIGNHFSFVWAVYFVVCSFLMYLIGDGFGREIQSGRQFIYLLLLFAVSVALPHIIITLIDIRMYGLINPMRQLQVLGDEVQMDTTARAIELSLAISGIAFLFYPASTKSDKRMKWLFIAFSVISEICAIHYLSRTGYLLFGLSFVLGFLFYRLKPRAGTILILITIAALIFVLWDAIQSSEIVALFEDREVEEESSLATGGGRFDRWLRGLNGLFIYPFGDSVSKYYCHNLWLDFGRCFGFFPFLLLAVFSLKNLRYSVRLFRNPSIEMDLRFCVFLFSIVFFLCCFTECIHEGMPAYFFLYCMYCGIIASLYKRLRLHHFNSFQ